MKRLLFLVFAIALIGVPLMAEQKISKSDTEQLTDLINKVYGDAKVVVNEAVKIAPEVLQKQMDYQIWLNQVWMKILVALTGGLLILVIISIILYSKDTCSEWWSGIVFPPMLMLMLLGIIFACFATLKNIEMNPKGFMIELFRQYLK